MKRINYLILATLVALTTSCVDDTTDIDAITGGTNVAGFLSGSASVSAVAGGEETSFTKEITVAIVGPSVESVNGTVTATVAVNEELTTAEAGVHYTLDQTSFTIEPGDNGFSTFSFTMLTDGIEPPLAANPVLALDVTQTTGDNKVVASGTTIKINMLYLCFADLSGTYSVTNDFCSPTFTATITPNPDGSWYSTVADGGFLHTCTSNTTLLNWGSFNEVCGVIQPSTDLRYGSLPIGTILGGTWDQENGIIQMDHEEAFFTNGPYSWSSTYTRID